MARCTSVPPLASSSCSTHRLGRTRRRRESRDRARICFASLYFDRNRSGGVATRPRGRSRCAWQRMAIARVPESFARSWRSCVRRSGICAVAWPGGAPSRAPRESTHAAVSSPRCRASSGARSDDPLPVGERNPRAMQSNFLSPRGKMKWRGDPRRSAPRPAPLRCARPGRSSPRTPAALVRVLRLLRGRSCLCEEGTSSRPRACRSARGSNCR